MSFKWVVFTVLLLTASVAWSQSNIEGTVVDAAGEALPGVNVMVKGTSSGTITDVMGKYSLSLPGNQDQTVLIFTYIGFLTQEVQVGTRTRIDVSLEEDISSLDEVVIVGYGRQQKKDLTGSISTVSGKDLSQLPVAGIDQAMQGRAAGVSVTQNTGAPGEGVAVRIRGVGSINGRNDPLYVVDGIPTTDALNSLAPQDIESISILKDAAAAAIYGSRANNGVVLITTKKGKEGKVKVDVNTQMGVQQVGRLTSLTNRDQYIDMYNEAARNDNAFKTNPILMRPLITDELASTLPDVDHLGSIFRGGTEALIQNHNISISGSEGNTRFMISGSYFDQEGIIIGSGFNRITGRVNLESDVSEKLTIGVNLNIARSSRDIIGSSGDGAGGNGGSVIRYALFRTPAIPIRDDNGQFVDMPQHPQFFGDGFNPVGLAEFQDNTRSEDRYFGRAFVNYEIIEGLTFTSNLGLDVSNFNQRRFDRNWGTNGRINNPNRLTVTNGRFNSYTLNNFLNFSRSINNIHNFSATLGSEAIRTEGYDAMATNQNFVDQEPNLVYLGNGQGVVNAFENQFAYSLLSFFGRVNYDYDRRYLVSATLRRDGSSRFAEGNRWGTFYSGSVGWRLDRESFLEDVSFLDLLKVRASYGVMGNQEIDNYAFANQIGINFNYPLGGVMQDGYVPIILGNDQVQWETSEQINVGMDVELFDGKIFLSLDYFNKVTDNMLVREPNPPSAGFSAPAWVNNGKILNRGFEVAIEYRNRKNALGYSIGGNMATLHNEVLSLSAPLAGGQIGSFFATRTEVGHPIGSFFLLEQEGIFQNETDIFTHAFQGSAIRPGDVKYKDQDGNGIIDENDRIHVGNPIPDLTVGFNLSVDYKNWDFLAFFQGAFGHDILYVVGRDIEGFYRPFTVTTRAYENRWTGEGTSNEFPRATWDGSANNTRYSTRFLQDGSYLRLRNIQLGYTLPLELAQRFGMERCRLYFSGHNLWTLTNYIGLDPEMTTSDNAQGEQDRSAGMDWGTYPLAVSYNFGINITF